MNNYTEERSLVKPLGFRGMHVITMVLRGEKVCPIAEKDDPLLIGMDKDFFTAWHWDDAVEDLVNTFGDRFDDVGMLSDLWRYEWREISDDELRDVSDDAQ